MELDENPLLQPENYMAGYDKSMEEYQNNPEVVAFSKFCYEVFEHYEPGRKFLEYAKERFIVHSQVVRGQKDYESGVIWQEGFRDAYRMIIQHVMAHKQLIKAGEKKQ